MIGAVVLAAGASSRYGTSPPKQAVFLPRVLAALRASCVDEIVVVTEREIADSMRWLARMHAARVEGSGAVGVAALLSRGGWDGPVAAIVSGGNVDQSVWGEIVGETAAVA